MRHSLSRLPTLILSIARWIVSHPKARTGAEFCLVALGLLASISPAVADGPFSTCPYYTWKINVDKSYENKYLAAEACIADAAAGVNPGCGTLQDHINDPRYGSVVIPANISTIPSGYSPAHITPAIGGGIWYYANQCWDLWIYRYPLPEKNACPNNNTNTTGSTYGNPCNAANGTKLQFETDYRTDGLPPLTRTYNSLTSIDRGLGLGWTSAFHKRLKVSASGTNLVILRDDSSRESFNNNTAGLWSGDADTRFVLTQDASGYSLLLQNGGHERYNLAGLLMAETDASGKTTSYLYNSTNTLASVTGPLGHALSFTYNAQGQLSSVSLPGSGAINYAYDANRLVRVDYPDGTARIYHYSNSGALPHLLTGISNVNTAGAASRYATYEYDGSGRAILTQHADVGFGGPQEKFTFTYDSDSQTTVTDAVGTKEVLIFHTNLGVRNLYQKTNSADGKVLNQIFDANNNLTCKKDEENRVTTWTYNATNQKLSQTEGQGGTCNAPAATAATRTTTYQYLSPTLSLPTLVETPSVYAGSKKRVTIGYSGNLPTTITQSGFTPTGAAVSRTATMTYNARGQVTAIDGPRADVADVTTLAYNDCATGGGCGQLQRVTNALGHVTTYDSYDAAGRLLQMTDPNGVRTIYTYDPRGRVATMTQSATGSANRVTQYTYDLMGNIATTTLPTGLTLTYAYDAANYLRRVTDNLGNYIDYGYDLKGNRTQTYTYDAAGTLVRTVDLAFDARNHVNQINAGGSITQQISDAVGNLTQVTDPNTVAAAGTTATVNSYDTLNRLFQTVDRLGGATTYSYDPNDRLKTVAAPNGAVTQYQYDDLGNLLTEISPDRGTVSYAYDAAGNLTQQTDARGIVSTYVYDALNRLTRVDYPGTAEDIATTYDSGPNCTFGLGRPCAVTDESGTTSYAYDAFGNLLTQTHTELNVTYTTRYTYDAGNRITSIVYPDNRTVTYQRDVLGRITSVATPVNGTATTVVGARSFRPDGLLLTQTFANGINEVRQYDTQGRLTYQSLATADTRLYAYDANGNLKGLQSLPQVGSYGYDALDRLTAQTLNTAPYAATYDPNGNRLTATAPGQSARLAYAAQANRLTQVTINAVPYALTLDAAGNTTGIGSPQGTAGLAYNAAGRLSALAHNGLPLASYAYDARALRTRKTTAQGTLIYHHDLQGRLLLETTGTGVALRAYVHDDTAPLAQIDRAGTAERALYLHIDHLATPRLATDATQTVRWRHEGEAFGSTPPLEDPDGDGVMTVVNLRFPGQYYDAETGLHYNWNRYYDPRVGRYVTSDPIGLAGGLNSFSYAYNNSLRFADPSGLDVALPSPIGPIPVPIPIPGAPPGGTIGGGENKAPVTMSQLGKELRQLGMGMCLAVITAANPALAITANGHSTSCNTGGGGSCGGDGCSQWKADLIQYRENIEMLEAITGKRDSNGRVIHDSRVSSYNAQCGKSHGRLAPMLDVVD